MYVQISSSKRQPSPFSRPHILYYEHVYTMNMTRILLSYMSLSKLLKVVILPNMNLDHFPHGLINARGPKQLAQA